MTDEKDLYASGEPGLSYDPLEVDEGWEPPYRNKNACFEQKLAKDKENTELPRIKNND